MQRGRDGSGMPRRRKGSSLLGQCPQEHSALQDDTGDGRGKRWGRGGRRILLLSLLRNSEEKKRKENKKKTTENHKDPPLPFTFLVQRFGLWVLGFFFSLFVLCLFFLFVCFSRLFFFPELFLKCTFYKVYQVFSYLKPNVNSSL